MKKFISLLMIALGFAIVEPQLLPYGIAHAVEINTDVGCDNPSAYMTMGAGAGTITVSGSKCSFSGVTRMKMFGQMSTKIKAGHRYRGVVAISNYSAGQLRWGVGVTMPSAPTGSYVLASSVTPIADNFTTSLGLTTGAYKTTAGPGDSGEDIGAFRFDCNTAGYGYKDPIVYPGLAAAHGHIGAGNTGLWTQRGSESWTYSDFRTKGGSSCSNRSDPKHAVVRAAYWTPYMLDGLGNVKKAAEWVFYYKGVTDPNLPTTATATGSISGTTLTVTSVSANQIPGGGAPITGTGISAGTKIMQQLSGTNGGAGTYQVNNSQTVASTTITVNSPYTNSGPASDVTGFCSAHTPAPHTCIFFPPTGLRMVSGWRSSDGMCGPTDNTNISSPTVAGCSIRDNVAIDCYGGPNGEGGVQGQAYTSVYTNLAAIMNANVCVKGSWLRIGGNYPSCWDNTNIDSPDHRSHIDYGNNISACLTGHGTKMPVITIVAQFYRVDQAFLDKKWKLSSDEMASGCAGGPVTAGCTWHQDYQEAWSPTVSTKAANNCIKAHNTCSSGELGDGTSLTTNAFNDDGTSMGGNGYAKAQTTDVIPLTKFGMSKDMAANGTYTFDITAAGDGQWELMGLNGATMDVDNISIQEIPAGAKGPVTVHN